MPATPFMGLSLPTPGQTNDFTGESQLITAFGLIDAHDHSSGNGVKVPTTGLSIDADLPFNSTGTARNATGLRSARFVSQGSTLTALTDTSCVYFSGGNLYANNGSGQAVQITSGSTLSASSIGGISGLAAPASVAYSAGTYVFTSNTGKAAIVDVGPIIIRDTGTSALGITLQSPTSLASGYTLTLPAALPGSTLLLSLSAAGLIGTVTYPLATASIADGAITRAKLAAVGQQTSSSSGTGTYNGAKTDSAVTGTVTLTTTGRPVLLILQPDGTNPAWTGMAGSQTGNLNLARAGVDIATWQFNIQAGVSYGIPITPVYLDVVGAGTYTYQMTITQASGISNVNSYKLVAHEL